MPRSFCLARNSLKGQGTKMGVNFCVRGGSCDQHYRATQHIRRKQVAATRIVSSSLDIVPSGRPWIQTSSATVDLKVVISSAMASVGVLQPRVFLGRFFIRFTMSLSHVWLASFRSVPMGMN
jgi:hypothetical protein